jgi:3-hydroxyacyl-CoA dehydrogenase
LPCRANAGQISLAKYDQHLARLGECDLVIEAIAEQADVKSGLYARIVPHLAGGAVLASNTSGLGINALAGVLPQALRRRFFGMHFFNPPRYMRLVELAAARGTDAALLDEVETFLVTTLGKGVVRVKDTPSFIANRIGIFALLAAIHHAGRLDLACDDVDALTGPVIGRPKSATFRTADLAGLDTLERTVGRMTEALAADPWHGHFRLPAWLRGLVEEGALGDKRGRGIYRKAGGVVHVFDPLAGHYRPATVSVEPVVADILQSKDAAERLERLRSCQHAHAQFLWAVQRDLWHYCAVHLADIADSARERATRRRHGERAAARVGSRSRPPRSAWPRRVVLAGARGCGPAFPPERLPAPAFSGAPVRRHA